MWCPGDRWTSYNCNCWVLNMFRTRKPEKDDLAGDDMVVIVEQAVNPFLVVFHEPSGFRAEQIRALRNKLIAMNPDSAAKTLVVTSAIRGEGKSVTAANLAMAFAQLDHCPVLLLDGDLRSPSLESYLSLGTQPGIADVLMGRVSLDEAIRETGINNLWMMGAGMDSAEGPSEIITSPKVGELFARLKQQFHYVIVDTSACLPATDASVFSTRADGTLVVVRLEHSSKTLTQEAIKNLQDLGGNILGTFVTEVRGADPEADPRLRGTSRGR